MADVVLSDGRQVTFDLFAITRNEYRALFDPGQSLDDEAKTLAKVSGLTPEAIANMPYGDFRQFSAVFFKKAREPLTDPKLPKPSGEH